MLFKYLVTTSELHVEAYSRSVPMYLPIDPSVNSLLTGKPKKASYDTGLIMLLPVETSVPDHY